MDADSRTVGVAKGSDLATDSPYGTLVNMCYQLRHENEELIEAMSLKSGLVETCEREIEMLKRRISTLEAAHSSENEQALSDKIDMGNDRLILIQESTRMDRTIREADLRIQQLESELSATREQVEILLNQAEIEGVNDDEEAEFHEEATEPVNEAHEKLVAQLRSEVSRLKTELENSHYIHRELESRVEVHRKRPRTHSDSSPRSYAPPAVHSVVAEKPAPTFVMSAEDSLLRTFESLVGYSIVKADDVVTLVSSRKPEIRVSFKLMESGEVGLIAPKEDQLDESAVAILTVFNSVPGFLAKIVLSQISRDIVNS